MCGGGAPCFRIGGAEDNFIFYIEYCFFFVPVMKLRWEYNISKQFQSISCLTVWLRAHFPPSKMLIWGKISIFDTKNLISRYFTTFQLPNHLHLQKMSKIQLYSYGKIQAKQIWLLKYTKTCPKLAVFGHFLIFSVFDVNFLRTLNPKSALLFIKCGIKYPKWPIYAKSVHKTELSNLTKNEIVLRPKHGAPLHGKYHLKFPFWLLEPLP